MTSCVSVYNRRTAHSDHCSRTHARTDPRTHARTHRRTGITPRRQVLCDEYNLRWPSHARPSHRPGCSAHPPHCLITHPPHCLNTHLRIVLSSCSLVCSLHVHDNRALLRMTKMTDCSYLLVWPLLVSRATTMHGTVGIFSVKSCIDVTLVEKPHIGNSTPARWPLSNSSLGMYLQFFKQNFFLRSLLK